MKQVILFVVVGLMLGGCNTIPEPLRVSENTPLVDFSDVRAMPNNHNGMDVRWGGVIAEVKTLHNKTMLEVVRMDLASSTRPKVEDKTEGRFRIYADGLLDPIIFEKGRQVTVLGKVAPSETGKIGELEYQYPVVTSNHVHLWKVKTIIRVEQPNIWHSPAYWHYRPTYRYYPAGYHGPIQGNVKPKIRPKPKTKTK
ncbi:Slp family lipoprotein [Thalassotalea crassostreae]|uniref:Slp family lipoprotein n=1 Tax=Thalassotalea crassostreae TaxID=1763536 RepID=UPI0008393544|nr:Slp family lipoprotein [Thalassotalea crassostreae]